MISVEINYEQSQAIALNVGHYSGELATEKEIIDFIEESVRMALEEIVEGYKRAHETKVIDINVDIIKEAPNDSP